jgi:hypothetical protein
MELGNVRLLRVLKGIATSAALWAVAWVPLTVGLAGVTALFGAPLPPREIWGVLLLRQAIVGALNGAVFGAALAILGRRRTFESLRYGLFAACGAIGGAVFPVVVTGVMLAVYDSLPLSAMVFSTGMSSFLGAVCGVESLRLARRATALPGATTDENRQLASTSA